MVRKLMMQCLAATAMFSVWADAWTDPDTGITWTYTVSDGKATIDGKDSCEPAIPDSCSGAITIPPTLGGYPVSGIGDYAFVYCGFIERVTIPDSVTNIGDYAFLGCRSLSCVTVGSGVKKIGKCAFDRCDRITSVHISDLSAWCAIDFGSVES